jgi:hypothetical protein
MPCSSKFVLPLLILAVPVVALAAERKFPSGGQPLSQAEIQNFDRMIDPEGVTPLPQREQHRVLGGGDPQLGGSEPR